MIPVLDQRSSRFFCSLPRISRKPKAKEMAEPVTAASTVVSRPSPKKRHVVILPKNAQ